MDRPFIQDELNDHHDEDEILVGTRSNNGRNFLCKQKAAESWGRRDVLIFVCSIVGLGVPAICWLVALCGGPVETDKIATVAVTLSIYTPLFAFVDNRGEKRNMRVKLAHFGFLWILVCNASYQLFWEMPWFLLKKDLMNGIEEQDIKYYWPWWAYGKADTRYLTHNDLTLAISTMDGSIAIIEMIALLFYVLDYRIIASWFSLVIGFALAWGQFYFYVGIFYNDFEQIEDGWFGLWWKCGVMNLPWVIFWLPTGVGHIWDLAYMYKKLAIKEFQESQDEGVMEQKSFMESTNLLLRIDENGNICKLQGSEHMSSRLMNLLLGTMFFLPWIVLFTDWGFGNY